MAERSLEKRVESLENGMHGPGGLFDRLGSLEVQFLEFRAEVRGEFSATRQDIRDLGTRVERIETRLIGTDARFEQIDARFDRIDARFEQVDARFDRIDARFEQVDARFERIDLRFDRMDERIDTLEHTLRAEIRAGDEETRSFMRILHEEVLARIATLKG